MDVFQIMGKLFLQGKEQFDKDIDDTSKKGSNLASRIGQGLETAAKIGAAAIGVAATAIGAMTKQSLDSFAEYEQLVGGSQLLFGDAYSFVADQAKNAYATVQMSQNEYLQQVNGFATGLKTALGGNEQAAAELASRIIRAEADVVAATGNSKEAIQNAFNGIMKSNFTMLDNLQLGITPTKQGFQDLIDNVNAYNKTLGKTTDYQIDNLADCQNALVDYIEMQGLAGYAANEAAGTIQGSLAMVKASWQNLLVGFADGTQDLDALIDGFVGSVKTSAQLIVPKLAQILGGLSTALGKIMPVVSAELPSLLKQLLPSLIQGATSLVIGLCNALPTILEILIAELPMVIEQLASALVSAFPVLLDTIKSLFAQVWDYIAVELLGTEADFDSTFSGIGEACSNAFSAIGEMIGELKVVFEGRWDEIVSAAEGAWNAIVEAFAPIAEVLGGLFEMAKLAIQIIWDNIPGYFNAVLSTIIGIFSVVEAVLSGDFRAAWDAIKKILDEWAGFFEGIWESVKAVFSDASSVGSQIVEDIKQGISNAWDGLVQWFKNVWDNLFGNLSVNVGVSGSGSPDGSHASGLDYVPFDGYIAELHKGEMVVPADEARMLRSGITAASVDSGTADLLMMILETLQEFRNTETVMTLNNREFGRAVRRVVNV